jgi:aspartokinase/homoserine dehydrogenase 1
MCNERYRYVVVSDRSGILVAKEYFDEQDLCRIIMLKENGGCLSDLRCDYEFHEDISSILSCSEIDVLVDVTDSQTFELLNEAIESVNVLLSNKIPIADVPFSMFKRFILKALNGSKILDFGTTVGAGIRMPDMISQMGAYGIDLIYGCLSGTMNYVSQRLNEDVVFSQAIKEAMSSPRYYTEPDPRVDLAGLDFARKLVILSRLTGESLNLEQIKIDHLIPSELMDLNLTEFLEVLDGLDPVLYKKYELARNNDKTVWFLGSADFINKNYEVGFKELPIDDPILGSKESDNVLKIFPKTWRRPVTIMGPGAGVNETVSGLIFKLSSMRAPA